MGKSSRASLRIASKVLTGSELSLLINKKPNSQHDIGERMSNRNPNSLIREESLAIFDSSLNDDEPLESHMLEIIELIKSNSQTLKESADLIEMSIECSFGTDNGQGGWTLDTDAICSLSEFPLQVNFDIYSY